MVILTSHPMPMMYSSSLPVVLQLQSLLATRMRLLFIQLAQEVINETAMIPAPALQAN